MYKFSTRLKELRIKNHLSYKKLAQILNVSPTTVSHWEKGKHDVNSNTLFKLAILFKVSVQYLLGLVD